MSTQVEILQIPIGGKAEEKAASHSATEVAIQSPRPPDSFTAEQIGALVHHVFFPAYGRARKQIVFSAVDEGVDVEGICTLVAESLSQQVSATVALADAHARSRDTAVDRESLRRPDRMEFAEKRGECNQLTGNLWSVPGPAFWGKGLHAGSPAWVRERLGELRTEFDYSLIHAPAAGVYSGTCLLGQVSDGLVLVIEANYTRRSAAQKAKEMLYAANVRLLGTILSGRTFPIPEGIYRRL